MSSSSHCNLVGHIPVIDVKSPSRNRIEIDTELILVDANQSFVATLHAYHEHAPQMRYWKSGLHLPIMVMPTLF